jgi:hypothetical protein
MMISHRHKYALVKPGKIAGSEQFKKQIEIFAYKL